MILLRYGNTNTFYIPGRDGGLLVDTDYAGTLGAFYRALKEKVLKLNDIACVMATHYHPDHMGLIGALMEQGVKLVLMDTQREHVHFSDGIFARDALQFTPIDETQASVVSCEESREYLKRMGISGQIVPTPSHSPDSVSLILDSGECIVGDLEPPEYIEAYENNEKLRGDWERIAAFRPKKICFAHMPAREER